MIIGWADGRVVVGREARRRHVLLSGRMGGYVFAGFVDSGHNGWVGGREVRWFGRSDGRSHGW